MSVDAMSACFVCREPFVDSEMELVSGRPWCRGCVENDAVRCCHCRQAFCVDIEEDAEDNFLCDDCVAKLEHPTIEPFEGEALREEFERLITDEDSLRVTAGPPEEARDSISATQNHQASGGPPLQWMLDVAGKLGALEATVAENVRWRQAQEARLRELELRLAAGSSALTAEVKSARPSERGAG